MKKLFLFFFCSIIISNVFAQVNPRSVYVNGYYRSNGTYVEGYYRTAPNYTIIDNYSTYPNVNPYTGRQGNIYPDFSTPSYPTQSNYSTNRNYTTRRYRYY